MTINHRLVNNLSNLFPGGRGGSSIGDIGKPRAKPSELVVGLGSRYNILEPEFLG